MVRARRIRREKLRENRYKEGYAKSLEGKRVEGDGDNIEQMRKQMKWAMVESTREVCGSVRVGEKTQRVCGGTMR